MIVFLLLLLDRLTLALAHVLDELLMVEPFDATKIVRSAQEMCQFRNLESGSGAECSPLPDISGSIPTVRRPIDYPAFRIENIRGWP